MSRILIVEDEERIASFVEKGLRANGFATTVASDGDAGVAMARSGRYDLLILDIGLPGIDGFQVLRELRETGSVVPVVILTARDSVQDTVAGLEGGADDYITKPFRFEEQERVFARFYRASEGRRSEGAGLGLSIVQAIARAHGGRLELASVPGSGATFTVVLPLGGPAPEGEGGS